MNMEGSTLQLKEIVVKNFRLLHNVTLSLEELTTVIVGRNNSGKTSLSELFRRMLSESPKFFLEDFSLISHDQFWNAFNLYKSGKPSEDIVGKIPSIELKLHINYDIESPDIGALSEFIIDLDESSNEAILFIEYKIDVESVSKLFSNISGGTKISVLKELNNRIHKVYRLSLLAIDPTNSSNQKNIDLINLRNFLRVDFITAQRGLDDITHKERDFLGNFLGKIVQSINPQDTESEHIETKNKLDEIIKEIQGKIDSDFNEALDKLLPTLGLFGYPGLNDPKLKTETMLDVQKLLNNHTKVKYGEEGTITLPENYNGLGTRNLIYILFQLFEFSNSFNNSELHKGGLHLIFVEEPEVHLHPQMQEVFIRKLKEVSQKLIQKYDFWPVKFIVTTHSTHIANEAPLESIRYFLNKKGDNNFNTVQIKDLRSVLRTNRFENDRDFLQKFMTLTKCDLFFADKAVLVEGASERLLLPKMIEKCNFENNLRSKYISIIEVGGFHAYRFFELLKFIELHALVITDLDSVNDEGRKCVVANSSGTSNITLKKWFQDETVLPADLLRKCNDMKVRSKIKIVYQIPEESGVCGRSFEDAFILANESLFDMQETTENKDQCAFNKVTKINKTSFALKYGTEQTEWIVPKYIVQGLEWLNSNE